MPIELPYLFAEATPGSRLAAFISSIPIDDAILTASTEVETLPVENLQYPEPERVWRATSTNATIIGQLSSEIAINSIAAVAHNGTALAEWRLQIGPTENSVTGVDSPTYDSTMVSMWPTTGKPEETGLANLSSQLIFDNDDDVLWFSLEFDDPTNTDNFEVGRILIDRAVRVKIGGQIGLQVSTMGDKRVGDFNRVFGDVRGPNSRKMAIPMNAIDSIDFRRYIFPYQLKHGKVKDFFFVADPTADAELWLYSMQCTFGDMSTFARQLIFNSNGGMWAGVLPLLEHT